MVYIRFEGDTHEEDYWDYNEPYPEWYNDDSFIFNSLSDFNSIPSNNKSISNYYYEMTKHQSSSDRFKFYGIPTAVTIDPSGISGTNAWRDLTIRACDEIKNMPYRDMFYCNLITKKTFQII